MRKILIVANNLAGGGAEKVLLTLLNELRSPDYSVDLLLIKNKGIYFEEIPDYVSVSWMLDVTEKDIAFPTDPEELKKYYRENIKSDYDVEIAFLEGPPTKFISCSLNKNSLKITWVHTDMKNVHWTKDYYSSIDEERDTYKSFDRIVFVSKGAQKGFSELFQYCPQQALVIQNPISVDEIQTMADEITVAKEGLTGCIVGSLAIRKGHSRLLYSMGRLAREGYSFYLWVIGDGTEKKALQELASLLGIDEYVKFLGFKRNPYPYMKAADFFISVSLSEGYPLVGCEALALEKPSVITRCAGNTDVFQNGKYGLMVPNTEEGIYCGLKEILENPSQLTQLKEKATQGKTLLEYQQNISKIHRLLGGDDQ